MITYKSTAIICDMRILCIIDSLGTGGAERSSADFWYFLRQHGATLKIVALSHRAEGVEGELVASKFDIHFIRKKRLLGQVREIGGIIQEFKPDLVHSILFQSNIRVRLARHVKKFLHLESLVNEMYSPFRLSDPNVTRIKLAGYRLLDSVTQRRGVDHFHANGNSVAQHYKNKLKIAQQRITVIPRGRNNNPYVGDHLTRERVRQELTTGGRIMLLNIARQEFQKGIDVLIEAMNNLGAEKEKVQLVLVGREGNMTLRIKEKIRSYQLEQSVVLLGHRHDVSSLLVAADIFVFPSRFEGLPGALIEAEAAGLPIICSDIPNNREVVDENVNALFFPVDDRHKLADFLKQLANDEHSRRRLGNESLRIFKERFNAEEIHQRMEALFEELVRKSKTDY